MAQSTQTSRIYSFSDFTSVASNDDINTGILNQTLQSDGYVIEKPTSVFRSGTSVTIQWTEIVSAETFTAVDDVVAAHIGGSYSEIPITETSEEESSDDTGYEITKISLSTGLLPAGNYLAIWYCEAKTENANGLVKSSLYTVKNEEAEVENGASISSSLEYVPFSGSFPIIADDGDTYTIRIAYSKADEIINTVYIKRARLFLVRM